MKFFAFLTIFLSVAVSENVSEEAIVARVLDAISQGLFEHIPIGILWYLGQLIVIDQNNFLWLS